MNFMRMQHGYECHEESEKCRGISWCLVGGHPVEYIISLVRKANGHTAKVAPEKVSFFRWFSAEMAARGGRYC